MFLAVAAPAAPAAPTMMAGSIFVVLLLALAVDYASVGPDSLRDRAAFVLGVSAIRAGWDGSALDRWTVDQLSDWITQIAATGNASLAGGRHDVIVQTQAHADEIIGSLVGLVMLYAIGVMVPTKWSRKLGGFARLAFGKGGGGKSGLNGRLWACALVLGLLGDLTHGSVGGTVNGLLDIIVPLVGKLPDWLFIKVAGS